MGSNPTVAFSSSSDRDVGNLCDTASQRPTVGFEPTFREAKARGVDAPKGRREPQASVSHRGGSFIASRVSLGWLSGFDHLSKKPAFKSFLSWACHSSPRSAKRIHVGSTPRRGAASDPRQRITRRSRPKAALPKAQPRKARSHPTAARTALSVRAAPAGATKLLAAGFERRPVAAWRPFPRLLAALRAAAVEKARSPRPAAGRGDRGAEPPPGASR